MSVKSAKLFFIFLCVAYKSLSQISILPVFGDKPITDDAWFVTKNKDSIQFDNICFYISNIQFETVDNQPVSDIEKAHLVDVFEPTSLKIPFENIDFKTIKTLRFNIGIDSLTNVSGALGGDLDPQKGMYWAWQSGYINMKIEGRSPQCKNRKNVFQYHIGGYLQPFYTMRQVEIPINAKNTEGVSDVRKTPKSEIRNPKYTEGVVLRIDFSNFFDNITVSTQNSIMMPCKEAMQLADYSIKMFSVSTHEK
jgi:hypothetical protein